MSDDKQQLDPRVAEVRGMLYLDDDSDDGLLSRYVKAADAFVRNAIGDADGFYADPRVKDLFAEAVEALAATYFENRLSLSDTQAYPVDLTVNSVIAQLRGIYDVYTEEQDTKQN